MKKLGLLLCSLYSSGCISLAHWNKERMVAVTQGVGYAAIQPDYKSGSLQQGVGINVRTVQKNESSQEHSNQFSYHGYFSGKQPFHTLGLAEGVRVLGDNYNRSLECMVKMASMGIAENGHVSWTPLLGWNLTLEPVYLQLGVEARVGKEKNIGTSIELGIAW